MSILGYCFRLGRHYTVLFTSSAARGAWTVVVISGVIDQTVAFAAAAFASCPPVQDAVYPFFAALEFVGHFCISVKDIAAAPDLLAALQEVVSVANRKTVEFDLAHAAIAKAKGLQNV